MKNQKKGIAKKLLATCLACVSVFAVCSTGAFAYSTYNNPYRIGELITWQKWRPFENDYFTYKTYMRGDIDGNDKIDLTDYATLIACGDWSWWDCLILGHREYADINNDWRIDETDRQILLDYLQSH